MPAIIDNILRAGEGRTLRKLKAIVGQVNSIEDDFRQMTDAELRAMTDELRQRHADGESLDDLLPEAFATVREAATRVLGQRHFDVQLMGGGALHLGNIAEMKTGEGKTLTAVLPSYLNALTGRGVHVVTVNDYLAKYHAEWMGRVHRFLGLDVGVILSNMDPEERRESRLPESWCRRRGSLAMAGKQAAEVVGDGAGVSARTVDVGGGPSAQHRHAEDVEPWWAGDHATAVVEAADFVTRSGDLKPGVVGPEAGRP